MFPISTSLRSNCIMFSPSWISIVVAGMAIDIVEGISDARVA